MQNCKGFRSAEFAGTNHRLFVATLKLRLQFRIMVSSNQVRLDVHRLRDKSAAQEYKRELSKSFGKPDDPEKLWTYFNTKDPKMSDVGRTKMSASWTFQVYIERDTPGTSNSFLTEETLNIIESRRAEHEWKIGQDQDLKLGVVSKARRDKEAEICGVCLTVGSHLWLHDSRPTNTGIRKLPPLGLRPAVLQ